MQNNRRPMNSQLRTIISLAIFFLSAISSFAITDEREFKVINAANGLADNSAQTVNCTKTGRMIISTIGNLNFYDGSSFTHIDTHEDLQYQLPLYSGHYHLYFDRYHHIWLKNKGVVTCVDLYKERFVKDVDSVVTKVFECNEQVFDLFVDSIGDVWFLTQKGLYGARQKQTYHVLTDYNLQDLDIFGNMLVLFYSNGEEEGIDLTTGRVLHRTRAYDASEAGKYHKTSLVLRHEDGFFQIRNGEKCGVLMYFDVKQLKWTKIMEQDYHLNSLAMQNGYLYLASEYGYWIYDKATGEKKQEPLLKLAGSNKMLETSTNTVAFDRQGGMWIGTEKRGLLYAHPRMSPFKVYYWDHPLAVKYTAMLEDIEEYVGEFKGMKTSCKLKDSRDWTWFGTSVGLYLYKTPQSKPIIFTKRNGFLNNVIHSVVEDKNHNIWVSTSYGISCIIFENDKPVFVNSFNARDDVPNESFINGKARCLDDGMIIMQSIDHVVAFYPDAFIVTNARKPFRMFPKLVRLLVNGNYVEPGEEKDGNVIIDRAITRVRDISLNADQNSISLTFSGLNYYRPVQTYYRVKVRGLQDEWRVFSYYDGDGMVDRQGMLHLPLVGLKPGSYDVAVQASLFPDIWPDEKEAFVWTIHVNQPWWKSTGVVLLLGVLVLAMLIANFFLYNRNSKIRIQMNAREGDMIRRIVSFASRCDMYFSSTFTYDNGTGFDESESNQPTKEFIQLMMRLLPYIRKQRQEQMTMRGLSEAGGVDVTQLYETLSNQLYKSPRSVALHILLIKAAELLRTTTKSVEEISEECCFSTPNYFMGNFFHQYKVTPREYREENS